MTPMLRTFYIAINSDNSPYKTEKEDKSIFTIADGMVQYLLKDVLFKDKFMGIVGEESSVVEININDDKNNVADYSVTEEGKAPIKIHPGFKPIIDKTKQEILKLVESLKEYNYFDKYVFIDPIDGTREFANEKGYESTICIGFSSSDGKPWAGIVYRPIPLPNSTNIKTIEDLNKPPNIDDLTTITYAYGCKSAEIIVKKLDEVNIENLVTERRFEPSPSSKKTFTKYIDKIKIKDPKLLTSNGEISSFLLKLIDKGFKRIYSGGAGNKMLMVLEGKGTAYIQDRGIFRWDTCAAQAVIEAAGGVCSKLTSVIKDGTTSSYIYQETQSNLDYDNCYDDNDENKPSLTMYNYNKKKPEFNNMDKNKITLLNKNKKVFDKSYFSPYINLCGIVAYLNPMYTDQIMTMLKGLSKEIPPSYD